MLRTLQNTKAILQHEQNLTVTQYILCSIWKRIFTRKTLSTNHSWFWWPFVYQKLFLKKKPTVKISVISESFTKILVNIHLISIIVSLKNLVMLQNPVILLRYVGTQHTGGCGTKVNASQNNFNKFSPLSHSYRFHHDKRAPETLQCRERDHIWPFHRQLRISRLYQI